MDEEHAPGGFNVCVPCGAPPLVRDFLMPGVIHYMKSLFTRYQLVTELFQAECEAAEPAEPQWLSSLRHVAQESAEAYSGEVEPFVILLDTLYTSPEAIEKKFPLDFRACKSPCRRENPRRRESPLEGSQKFVNPFSSEDTSDAAALIMAELLKTSAAFVGAHIDITPGLCELPRNNCFRMFGPLSTAVYLMLREGGAERVEIGVLEVEGRQSIGISSRAQLHRMTLEELVNYGCIHEGFGPDANSSCPPWSVLCRYTFENGTGTLRLYP